MKSMNASITEFFADYELLFNRSPQNPTIVDIEGTAAASSDCFIEAGPSGLNCGRNDAKFREPIP